MVAGQGADELRAVEALKPWRRRGKKKEWEAGKKGKGAWRTMASR